MVATRIWNEGKTFRFRVFGKVQTSQKKQQSIYYARSARRQRVMLWALSILKEVFGKDKSEAGEMGVEWADYRAGIARARYTQRKVKGREKNAALEQGILQYPPAKRVAAQQLFHSAVEGTMQAVERDGKMHFERPGFIRDGKIKVKKFYPLVGEAELDEAEVSTIVDDARTPDALGEDQSDTDDSDHSDRSDENDSSDGCSDDSSDDNRRAKSRRS